MGRRPRPHPRSACPLLVYGFGVAFLCAINYIIDSYLLFAASAVADNTIMRSLFGVGFPLFTAPMYERQGINWARSLLGFLTLLFIPMPIVFYVYGCRIRRMTPYGREADDLGQKLRAMALQKAKQGEPSV